MKGKIYAINHQRGMVAVQTEEGDFSVFELLGNDNVEVGDEITRKNRTSLGATQITNFTHKQSFDVYFQNHWVTKNQLKQQLLIQE